MQKRMMTLSERAADLGVFALDSELQNDMDFSEPLSYEIFNQPETEDRFVEPQAICR